MARTNGTREAAQLAAMARRAADLGAGAAPAAIEAKGRHQAELKLGMRCAGCEERIGVGLEFTRIDVVMVKGKPTIDVQKLACCNGADGCKFAEEARGAADAMTMVEYVWLNGDAPVGAGLAVEDAVEQAERAAGGRLDDDEPPASGAEERARG